jgi:hypothetical protein
MSLRKARAELKMLKETVAPKHERPRTVYVQAFRGETEDEALARYGIDQRHAAIRFVSLQHEGDMWLAALDDGKTHEERLEELI